MRAGAALAVAAALISSSCKDETAPPPASSGPPSPELSASEPAPSAPPPAPSLSPAVASAVLAIRETTLPVTAPPIAPQRLAFGKGVLGELGADRLLVRGGKEEISVALREPRALVTLPSGALLALGAEGVYRLEPGAKKPRRYGHVVFFPDSELFPELADDRAFWVTHRSTKIAFRFRFEDGERSVLLPELETPLEGFDGRALAMHRDGVFVYSTDDGIARLVPRVRVTRMKRPEQASPEPIWRLLAPERLDRIWVVSERGGVELWQFAPVATLIRRFEIAPDPYEVAVTDSALAAIVVTQGGGRPRSFSLVVYDLEGRERFRHELPSDPATTDDSWLAAVTRNKNLAISGREQKVAVGGPTWLGVWDLSTGQKTVAGQSRDKVGPVRPAGQIGR